MNRLLSILLANKHTSAAGIIYVGTKIGVQLGAIWFPQYKDKLDATAQVIEGAAVAYGLLAAGDAKKVTPEQPTP